MIDPAHYVPFADPAFAPDWRPEDRPDWPAKPTGEAADAFGAYCLRQLDELNRRAWMLRQKGTRPNPMMDRLWEASREYHGEYERQLPHFLDMIGMSREEYEKLILRRLEEDDAGESRRGPTKNAPRSGDRHPSSLAAEDMAKLRFVIFPRFWLDTERNDRTFNARSVAHLAASRYADCEPGAAYSRYNKSGLPALFRKAAARLRN